jgi:outer membrane lipoprotein carrier protein
MLIHLSLLKPSNKSKVIILKSIALIASLLLLISLPTTLFAATTVKTSTITSSSSASDQLGQILANLQSMQANFEQAVLDNNGGTLQSSSGKMALARPGKFRWETNVPSKQLLIADGKTVWIYDTDLKQVTRKKQNTKSQVTPAMLLSDSTPFLLQSFQVKLLPTQNSTEKWFRLTPKSKESLFQSTTLVFQNNELRIMQIISTIGQRTVLRFSQVKNNPTLKANIFQFHIPKGVDVVNN